MIYRYAFLLKGAWLWRDLPVSMSSLCLDLENSVQVLSFPLHPCFTAPWWERHLTYGAGDWRPLVDNSILFAEVVFVSMLWWLLEPRNVNKKTCFWNPSHMTNITFAQNTTKLESCTGIKKKKKQPRDNSCVKSMSLSRWLLTLYLFQYFQKFARKRSLVPGGP